MTETAYIAHDDDGIRIDRWFRRHYPALTHGRLEKLLRTGQVRLDGKRAKAADRVVAGQSVRLPPQVVHGDLAEKPRPKPPPTAQGSLEDAILYMDKSVIVLNKPSGLATQGGSGLTQHVDGMLDSLAFEKGTRPKLVHRLDRDTSGVLVVARTATAAAELSRALATRDAQKIYWALTKGVPKVKRGTIKAALAKEGGHGPHGRDERMTTVDAADEGAKDAITDFAVLATAGEEFAWLAVKPLTGRTHQIRVHLASIGTPIVGDFKYGGTDVRGKGEIDNRLHLHARAIDIARPDGGRLAVTAPLPAHMLRTWTLLGFDPERPGNPFERPAKKKTGRAPKTDARATVLRNKNKPKRKS
ncbi:MAG TPA: RluA family pseudouridine synthase [Rhizomicrobium sp.]|jgi:23S rRNA pseudouridine955/2504/2580 synthase|nr:RluA family pseudouridine synthase [Rhizomicrobium sp.]